MRYDLEVTYHLKTGGRLVQTFPRVSTNDDLAESQGRTKFVELLEDMGDRDGALFESPHEAVGKLEADEVSRMVYIPGHDIKKVEGRLRKIQDGPPPLAE